MIKDELIKKTLGYQLKNLRIEMLKLLLEITRVKPFSFIKLISKRIEKLKIQAEDDLKEYFNSFKS